jgi:aldehyde dehydrogenase (NAD+)
MDIQQLISSQKAFFNTNKTKDISFRIQQLQKLEHVLRSNEKALNEAIFEDFKKSPFQNYMSELSLLFHDIHDACKNLKHWSKPQKANTNSVNFPAKSYIQAEPLGCVLVIGAWNYPYQLSFAPAIAAIAAGNTVIIKPSELPIHTSNIMAKLIRENFDPSFFSVVEGGIEETTILINQKFDKIFFTGSTHVGRIVYQAAAKNLVPVTLELGGKSPVFFTETGNIKNGVKRLVWAKFLNAGQTCVAPDYILVHKSIKKEFLKALVEEIKQSCFSFENGNYVQIINEKNMMHLIDLLDKNKIHVGGTYDIEKRYMEPTIMSEVTFSDRVMEKEIFGPILPVIEYNNLDEVIAQVKAQPKPLSCYVFSDDQTQIKKILNEISFGGGAVNDALMHLTNSYLPFGGVGDSGMGSYHGEYGFKTFSHYKGILHKPTWFEAKLKYYPFSKIKLDLLKRIIE